MYTVGVERSSPTSVIQVLDLSGTPPFDADPVLQSLRLAQNAGKVVVGQQLEKTLNALSVALRIRHEIIRSCIEHLGRLANETAASTGHSPGAREIPADRSLQYTLLLLVDSFLFETRSYEELLRKFFVRVIRGTPLKERMCAEAVYKTLKIKIGLINDQPWEEFLSTVRNKLTHECAPWIAIDQSNPDDPDVVVSYCRITDFASADPRQYFYLVTDLGQVWTSLTRLADMCEDCLVQEIDGIP